MTVVADVMAGWQPDPLNPTRHRWWDGYAWTAHVSAPDEAETNRVALSWTTALAWLPTPVKPEPVAVGDEARVGEPAPVVTPSSGRRRLAPVAIAAASLLVAGPAVAGAGVLGSHPQRPQLLPELSYRDDRAGFALRYPDDWRVLRRDHGGGIRFAIAAPGAPRTETNTVSVIVGTTPAALPALHTLVDQLTETLRATLPGLQFEAAQRARLADAPGFRLTFRDPDATPPTRIEQYVGRTTTGRPLTVTVTIRQPRTAPSAKELHEFIGSLDPS